jgi:inosose dehydratase
MVRDSLRISVGNAPCSWGRLELEDGEAGEQIGYGRMLDELVETGYTGTELGDWAYMPTEPGLLRAELQRRGLTMLGAFVPVAFADADAHEAGERHALNVAHLLAAVADVGDPDHRPFVVLADDNGRHPVRLRHAGRVTPEMMLDASGWEVFCGGVGRVAEAVHRDSGLPIVFHHHCAGFVETPAEIDQLLQRTDPELVGLVFDTGHYAFGAGRCEAVDDGLRRFSDRIRYVHFKDCSAATVQRSRQEGWDYVTSLRHGVFCELGEGCVDFPSVVERLRKLDYAGWIVVEQDVLPGMGAPKKSAARNRRYLAGIGL